MCSYNNAQLDLLPFEGTLKMRDWKMRDWKIWEQQTYGMPRVA